MVTQTPPGFYTPILRRALVLGIPQLRNTVLESPSAGILDPDPEAFRLLVSKTTGVLYAPPPRLPTQSPQLTLDLLPAGRCSLWGGDSWGPGPGCHDLGFVGSPSSCGLGGSGKDSS